MGPESLTCRFFTFHLISLCKTIDPQIRAIFCLRDTLNKHGRGPLGDATYQISRLQASLYKPM